MNAIALLGLTTPALAQRLPGERDAESLRHRTRAESRKRDLCRHRAHHGQARAASEDDHVEAAEITFDAVSVVAGGSSQTAKVALDPAREQATFTVTREIPAGEAQIA